MTKTPVVFLPGTLCNGKLWEPQIRSLESSADCIVADLTRSDTIRGMAEDVLAEAPSQFSLAGLSLGGIVALEIMRLAPERVKKLALLDTNPFLPTEKQLAGWKRLLESEKPLGFVHEITDNLITSLLHPDHWQDVQLTELLHQMAEDIGTEGYVNQLKAVKAREELITVLPTIHCPTLIIVGQQDIICPLSMSEYLRDHIKNSSLEVINHAGHLPTLERPDEVSRLMKEWLSSSPSN